MDFEVMAFLLRDRFEFVISDRQSFCTPGNLYGKKRDHDSVKI